MDKAKAVEAILTASSSSMSTTHKLTYFSEGNILHYHKDDGSGSSSSSGGSSTPVKSVAILAAGTSDLDVAEECALLLELTNGDAIRVERVYDVGVAGIHRLFQQLPRIRDCDCAVVVAGMDGALPSAVGGLIKAPVIACPTSVGYGAAFGGIAPLLTMLNSCAPGVSVVNIDNGFGAAVMAHKILALKD